MEYFLTDGLALVEQYAPLHPPLITMPLDFCLWRCVKNYVCRTSVNDTANFRARIINAIRSEAKRSVDP
jgi:hypothetical protein